MYGGETKHPAFTESLVFSRQVDQTGRSMSYLPFKMICFWIRRAETW